VGDFMDKLTTTHIWLIFSCVFGLTFASIIGLSEFTDFDSHTIRGISGLVMIALLSPFMIWVQIHWWRLGKKVEKMKNEKQAEE